MSTDEYVPSDQDIEDTYASTWLNFQNELGRERFRAWLAAHDTRVKRDAALHEKQRIAGEVRLWASINHDLANEGMGDLLDLVAGDIDRIPEETP